MAAQSKKPSRWKSFKRALSFRQKKRRSATDAASSPPPLPTLGFGVGPGPRAAVLTGDPYEVTRPSAEGMETELESLSQFLGQTDASEV
jgi:hypothetical protein